MVKSFVLSSLVLVGVMLSSSNGLASEGTSFSNDEQSYSVVFQVEGGDITPEALAAMTKLVAQNTISERDAVLSIINMYRLINNAYVQAVQAFKAADTCSVTDVAVKMNREQFVEDRLEKIMSSLLKIGKEYNLRMAIAQVCLSDDGMIKEIGALFPAKLNELLSRDFSSTDFVTDEAFKNAWYDVLIHALNVGMHEVCLAALTKCYPQYLTKGASVRVPEPAQQIPEMVDA